MRIVFSAIVIFCAFLLVLTGCNTSPSDPFAVFEGGFYADVTGELNGTAFSAVIEADVITADGTLPLTVTFYAPGGLSGTVLSRDATGNLSVSMGEVSFMPKDVDFSAFFALFPTSGEVMEVSLDKDGRTQVIFAGGSLLLLPDGTPFSVCTAAGEIRVLRWKKR